LHGAANHGDDDKLASCLSAYGHGRVDDDADGEGGLQGGKSGGHDGLIVCDETIEIWRFGNIYRNGEGDRDYARDSSCGEFT
jgi:hypothetical protein